MTGALLTINGSSSSIRFLGIVKLGSLPDGDRGIYLKQQLKDKLIEHKQYIDTYGEDMPEIRNWRWGHPK